VLHQSCVSLIAQHDISAHIYIGYT
jgi:hypothetical protein